mgnify:CR=1 FL=1
MNKKGFTLIELLAVIVVLAIIAIISVPIITDLINKSRYGAFGVTKKNIEHAAELYYAKNADDVYWEDNIAYVTIGTLKSKKFLSNNVVNTLDSTSISDDTKVLLYRSGRKVDYSLQLYDKQFFDWYQKEMVRASKSEDITLPTNVGETVTVDLETLMGKGLVDELRLPLELDNRCVGYVEIEKMADNYEYNAYVDCLQGASTFASHYVSYGGKYMDEFTDVKETSDGGYIAVGRSNSETITKYGNIGKGKYDAIIVKFKSDGTLEWSHNFGGSNNDVFYAVAESPDGYAAVGQTTSSDKDVLDYKGGNNDALIVKYNKQGEVVFKKSYGTSSAISTVESFSNIMFDNNHFIIVGRIAAATKDGDLEGETGLSSYCEGIILKYDVDFNFVWRKFFSAEIDEGFEGVTKTTDNNYIVVGASSSKLLAMEGYGYTTPTYQNEAIILKYDLNGNLIKLNSFQGSRTENFYDVVEVDDGYIVVGQSQSSDQDMEDVSVGKNGYKDAIIVKYDKTLDNVLWKKSFGGTDDDTFYAIEKVNNQEVIVVGYSKSTDLNMFNIAKSTGGYSNAILIKYNASNGDIIDKKIFGGTKSNEFTSLIKTSENNYIVSGSTFSSDIDLKNFNKGNQDALLINYDSNMNLKKVFQEPVVLIDKLKTIVPNYGTNISLKYDNIYTSNDPTKDLGNWCGSRDVYLEGNTSNYYFGECLTSFNQDDKKLLIDKEVNSGLRFHSGEYEYKLTVNPNHINSWYLLSVLCGNSGAVSMSNLKLKFADGYVGHITDAINKGYIEPLVVVNSRVNVFQPQLLLPNVIDIINENGNTGTGSYPSLFIIFKPKKSKLSSIFLTVNRGSNGNDGLSIHELRNFDMSITKTE